MSIVISGLLEIYFGIGIGIVDGFGGVQRPKLTFFSINISKFV